MSGNDTAPSMSAISHLNYLCLMSDTHRVNSEALIDFTSIVLHSYCIDILDSLGHSQLWVTMVWVWKVHFHMTYVNSLQMCIGSIAMVNIKYHIFQIKCELTRHEIIHISKYIHYTLDKLQEMYIFYYVWNPDESSTFCHI